MENRTAQIISYLFHPVFAPLYGIYLIFHTQLYIVYTLSDLAKWIVYFVVVINAVFFPLIITYFLYRKHLISDIQLSKRKDRFLPYVFFAGFYYFTFYLLRKIHIPPMLSGFIFGGFVSCLFLMTLNVRWKISIHTTAIGGLLGILFWISKFYLINTFEEMVFVILAGGIVGYARLYLQRHSPIEIYLGYLIGFVSELAAISLLTYDG